jgi:hypothetical protein
VQATLEGTGVVLLAIGPGTPAELGRYRDLLGLTMPLLSDPTWQSHSAYGMGRASARQTFLSPRHWIRYASLIARGSRPERPRQNILVLGGDVLLDADGEIVWAHHSRHLDDYSSVDVLRRATAPYVR